MATFTGNTSLLVAAPMLQDYFVDKTTGAPLAAGTVTFYRNANHTIFKAVYKQVEISNDPPVYHYEALTNPITLGASGTMVDENGDDFIPFYYPYTEGDNPVADPYYVVVKDANGVQQFTRENFPLVTETQQTDTEAQERINLFPNGQFLSHNNLPNDGVVPNGSSQVSAISTTNSNDSNNTSVIVAQGGAVGWYYIKPQASTSTDTITFSPITEIPTGLNGNPGYVMVINLGAPSVNDSFKHLRIRFNNVNRFASTNKYTIALTGKSATSDISVNVMTIKYYGANGSTQTQDIKGSLLFTPDEYHTKYLSFSFDANSATIDSNGGDYVEIALALPVDAAHILDLTNAELTPGEIAISAYPERPDHKVLDEAIAGSVPVPNPDGSDLYLPTILTRGGATFDHSVVGNIESSILSSTYVTDKQAKFLCDGLSKISSDYSPLGIPHARLGNVLISDSPIANTPKFGTGANFATCYENNGSTGTPAIIRLTLNKAGTPITDISDNGTGFTFPNGVMYNGIASSASIGLTAYSNIANTVLAVSNNTDLITAADVSSGITLTVNNFNTGILAQQKSSLILTAVTAAALIAGSGVPGKYFNFSVGSNNYFMWFLINGETQPAGSGTPIQITLNSTDTAQDVANIIREAFNAFKVNNIIISAVPTAGTYFAFKTNPGGVLSFFVWYSTGSTSAPVVPGSTGIKVLLGGSETPATVATKTLQAINAYQYAVPDFRGMFLRGLDPNGTWDLDKAQRWSTVSALSGANLGTFEFGQFLSHTHTGSTANVSADGSTANTAGLGDGSTSKGQSTLNIANAGGTETRPVNAAVNFYIRY